MRLPESAKSGWDVGIVDVNGFLSVEIRLQNLEGLGLQELRFALPPLFALAIAETVNLKARQLLGLGTDEKVDWPAANGKLYQMKVVR